VKDHDELEGARARINNEPRLIARLETIGTAYRAIQYSRVQLPQDLSSQKLVDGIVKDVGT